MKISRLRMTTALLPKNTGTGRHKGEEVIPFTRTAQLKFGLDPIDLPPPPPLELTEELSTDLVRLRPYQLEDVLLLANRAVGMILSDPRTGKTPTAISIFRVKGVKKYIVVCPASITYQWQEEIEYWSDNKAFTTPKAKNKRIEAYKEWETGVLVISYETLRVDWEEILGNNKDIEGIILDEAHKIKNPKSQNYIRLMKFKNIKHKLILTGTVSPNKAHEVYGAFSFVFPSVFTSYWRFVDYYFNVEVESRFQMIHGRPGQQEYKTIQGLSHPTEMQEFLERVAVRRSQAEVMPWLPEKDYYRIRLEPTREQKKYIKEMMDYFEIEDSEVIAENILTQLLRVRQICMAPELLELKGKSPKIDWIKQYLKDFEDESIIIFSNFTSFLKLLSEELGGVGMIVGDVSSEERNRLKNEFQAGTIKVLLVNIKAGKEGLTLDKAGTAIFCDTYPPAADIVQAENRITATTVEKANKDNKIYRLMMKDTYDERMYDLVDGNIEITSTINDYILYLKERRK